MYFMDSTQEGTRLEKKTDATEMRRQLQLAGLKPGMKALDAGAGTGAIARIMADLVGSKGQVTAFDGSLERLQQGEALAQDAGIKNLTFAQGDLMSLDMPEERFDFIWSRFVFEYLAKPDEVMDRLTRALADGGILAISDIDGYGLFHDGMSLELEYQWRQVLASFGEHFDPYAGRKLYRRFALRGFQNIQVHTMPYHFYPGTAPQDQLDNWNAKFETIRASVKKKLGAAFDFEKFKDETMAFFKDPHTFTYSTLFLVSGTSPGK